MGSALSRCLPAGSPRKPPKHDFDEYIKPPPDSAKWTKYGPDVIPMWVADTDFASPRPLIDALVKRSQMKMFGYGSLDTSPVQSAVTHWLATRFQLNVMPEAVVVTSSVVPALISAIVAFTEPGDKVMIQTPVYPPFHEIIGGCGRVKVTTEMRCLGAKAEEMGEPSWQMDFEDIERKCADPKLKIFLLCSPHNPLGRVYTKTELLRLTQICLKHNVLILSDEIHSDLVFPSSPQKHTSLPTLSPEVAQNTLLFLNPSKTFNIPGLKCAAVVIPNPTFRATYVAQMTAQHTLGSNVMGSLALQVCYKECAYYADQLMEYLQGNVDFALDYFSKRIPAIKMTKPEATYLIWLDCRSLSLSAEGLIEFFEKEAKLGVADGAMFGVEGMGFVRMNIACRRKTMEEALGRLERAVNKRLQRKVERKV